MENDKIYEELLGLKAEVAELRKMVYDLMEQKDESEQGIYLEAVPEYYRDFIVRELQDNRKTK